MKRLVIGAVAVCLLLGAAVYTSYAEQWGGGGMGYGPGEGCMAGGPGMMMHGGGFMHGPRGGRMQFLWKNLMALGLNDKQKDAIFAIRDRVMKDSIRQRADLQIARVELKELLRKDAVDMNAVEAKLKKTESLRTELRLQHIKALQEIKGVLTPEQRAKFKEALETRFMGGGRTGQSSVSSTKWDDAQVQAANDPSGTDTEEHLTW